MFQDWEHISDIGRQGIHQQCFAIGNNTAMSYLKICISNVIRLGIPQQGDRTDLPPHYYKIRINPA